MSDDMSDIRRAISKDMKVKFDRIGNIWKVNTAHIYPTHAQYCVGKRAT